jgi:hypothetical protein
MADKRAFAVFDVGYLDNPKIQDLLDAGPYAVLMHAASILYCAQHLTDGEVASGHMQRKVGGTAADTKVLIDKGLWHLPGHDCEHCPDPEEGKVYVHDYTEHNRTSAGVKRASEAGKRAAAGRWEKANPKAKRNAGRMRGASDPQSETQCENDDSAMPRQTDRQTQPEAKASGPRKRAKRIPEDFAITESMREWGRENAPTVDGQTETVKFINYWQAKAGRDATKLDWVATWRNWMLNAKERQPAAKKDPTENARSIMQMGRDLQEGALFDGFGANQPAISQGGAGG